jgi:hypothetical protein
MRYAKHIGQAPPLDARAFATTAGASAKTIEQFVNHKQWVEGSSEFDGSGLRDVVEANAGALDDLKGDFDQHRTMDNSRHSALAARVAALESQPSVPFPASG